MQEGQDEDRTITASLFRSQLAINSIISKPFLGRVGSNRPKTTFNRNYPYTTKHHGRKESRSTRKEDAKPSLSISFILLASLATVLAST